MLPFSSDTMKTFAKSIFGASLLFLHHQIALAQDCNTANIQGDGLKTYTESFHSSTVQACGVIVKAYTNNGDANLDVSVCKADGSRCWNFEGNFNPSPTSPYSCFDGSVTFSGGVQPISVKISCRDGSNCNYNALVETYGDCSSGGGGGVGGGGGGGEVGGSGGSPAGSSVSSDNLFAWLLDGGSAVCDNLGELPQGCTCTKATHDGFELACGLTLGLTYLGFTYLGLTYLSLTYLSIIYLGLT